MSLSPGDRVDRYEVIALLGSGGMGEVYRARDPKLARDVALKILRVDQGLGTDGPGRLLREARAAAMLSHANVLAVYDLGEVLEPEPLRGLAYIAMELVIGRPLRAYVGDETVPMERRIGWLRDIASALGAAHRAGIVHRDVKPENVMIRVDGVVKVLDFGIARRAAATFDPWSSTEGQAVVNASGGHPGANLPTLTGQGAVVGTPFYMAPEQLRGEVLDARADQFAWGVVAYYLLSGKPPWPGGTAPIAVLSQILSLNPPPPAEIDPRIPAGVSRLIMRTLEKPREMRFASMAELIEALDAAASLPPPVGGTGGWPRESEPSVSAGAVPASPAASTRPPMSGPLLGLPAEEKAPSTSKAVLSTLPARRRLRPFGIVLAAAGLAIAVVVVGSRTRSPQTGKAGTVTAATSMLATGGECTSNADCVHAHGGGAWRCHSQRHACVELASEDCKVYAGPRDAEADDVVWLGGLFPLRSEAGFLAEMRATDLARQDFAAALGPTAARSGPLHARPIGLVICDEDGDALRAARHLAEDVEAPAVIGFRSTTNALTAISTLFLPRHVLSMVSLSQAPDLTRIPQPADEPRLVWRSTLNRLHPAVALAHFISDVLEPTIRAAPDGIGERPLKVAAVWPKGASLDFVEGLFDTLHYNGRSALENDANFREFAFEPDADAGSSAEVVKAVLAFAPQVIVFGGPSFYARVLAPLEASWPEKSGARRPFYLTGSSFSHGVAQFAGRDPTKRHRFFGTNNLCATPTNAKLVLRYNLAFPGEPIARTKAPQPSYDAFYMLAYATYALGRDPVTGPDLARAFERLLPPGRKVDVGPGQIFEGFDALRSGANIDLNGAIGALDFDPSTGEAPIDYAIVCPSVDDEGNASAPIDSGLVYDAQAKKFTGELHCP